MRCLAEQGKPTTLLGRSLDLASAYRQLAIAGSLRKHAFLSVYDPASSSAELFQQVALPFGPRTAVNVSFVVHDSCNGQRRSVYDFPYLVTSMNCVLLPPQLASNSQAAFFV